MQTIRISDYKRAARARIKGQWGAAVRLNAFPAALQFISTFLVIILTIGIVALIGYLVTGGHDSAINSAMNSASTSAMSSDDGSFGTSFGDQLSSVLTQIIISMISTGILWTSLDWYRNQQGTVTFKDSMRGFARGKFLANFMLLLVMFLFKLLWTLLFIIPGIIKVFSYSQTLFIYKDIVDHNEPENIPTRWSWYISHSRRLMDGHKAELFWLELSFIGWYLVALLTFGIAWFWILPYVNMTRAVFYDNIAGDQFKKPVVITAF